jgi:predicted DNA-binding protein (MmcQ/YjbR family)
VTVRVIERLEPVLLAFPEAERVDVEEWGDHPTFRVRGKVFVFANEDGTDLTVKLDKVEAAAVVAEDRGIMPAGYGLGRHGWVAVHLEPATMDDDRWAELLEWVETSYRMVAPKALVRRLDESTA